MSRSAHSAVTPVALTAAVLGGVARPNTHHPAAHHRALATTPADDHAPQDFGAR